MLIKKLICTLFTVAVLLLSAVASAPVSPSGQPNFDEIIFQVIKTSLATKNALLAGQVDAIRGPGTRSYIEEVLAAGFNISFDDEAAFSFLSINSRDSFKPLNDPVFRIALTYMWGMDKKNASILEYCGGPWMYGIQSPVPPAQKPWFNPTVRMPAYSDNATAWTLLQTAGYYVNATDSKLYNPDGTAVRSLEVWYSGCGGWRYTAGGFVLTFNKFMGYINATGGPTMKLVAKDFMSFVNSLLVDHDYDFIGLGLTGLGRFVDWLYDFLHSDNIGPGGWNFAGLIDPVLDHYTEIIHTSLNHTEIVEAAWIVQEHFINDVMPWIPLSSSRMLTSYHPDLVDWISVPTYGSLQADWTWNLMHWKQYTHPTLGTNTLRFPLGDEPGNLNPLYENTKYGWDLLDRAFSELTIAEPYNLTDMPYVAYKWKVEPWISTPELRITNGSKVTFWLRQDVTWHDGKPVTAYDAAYALRLMRKYKPSRYSSVWTNLIYAEAEGPYKLTAYYSYASLHHQYNVADAALLLPEHIWSIAEEMVENGTWTNLAQFNPAGTSYKDWTGEDPPPKYPFMKAIVGTGAYVFDYYDRPTMTGRVQRNEEFFINETGIIGAVDAEHRVDPWTTATYNIIVQNMGAKDNVTGKLTSATVDIYVYEDGASAHNITGITLHPFTYQTFGPYTTSRLSAGPRTVKVELVEAGSGAALHTYTHTFAVTKKEDINLDYKVNIRDIAAAARAFGTYPTHIDWNPDADINDDFKVNIRDIAAIARRFGW